MMYYHVNKHRFIPHLISWCKDGIGFSWKDSNKKYINVRVLATKTKLIRELLR